MLFKHVKLHQTFKDDLNTRWKKHSTDEATCLDDHDPNYAPGATAKFGRAEEVTPCQEH